MAGEEWAGTRALFLGLAYALTLIRTDECSAPRSQTIPAVFQGLDTQPRLPIFFGLRKRPDLRLRGGRGGKKRRKATEIAPGEGPGAALAASMLEPAVDAEGLENLAVKGHVGVVKVQDELGRFVSVSRDKFLGGLAARQSCTALEPSLMQV